MRLSGNHALAIAGLMSLVAVIGSYSSALASGTTSEGYDYAYAGAGTQWGEWSQSNRTVRLHTMPNSGMSTSRCMDAMVDWKVKQPIFGHNHYDSRVVRSCKPGFDEETDPGGDGYWSEPSGWGGETPQGLQRGFGYIISDSTLEVLGSERFDDSGSLSLDPVPSTFGQGKARVRTLYQDGHVGSCNPLPVNDAADHGCS